MSASRFPRLRRWSRVVGPILAGTLATTALASTALGLATRADAIPRDLDDHATALAPAGPFVAIALAALVTIGAIVLAQELPARLGVRGRASLAAGLAFLALPALLVGVVWVPNLVTGGPIVAYEAIGELVAGRHARATFFGAVAAGGALAALAAVASAGRNARGGRVAIATGALLGFFATYGLADPECAWDDDWWHAAYHEGYTSFCVEAGALGGAVLAVGLTVVDDRLRRRARRVSGDDARFLVVLVGAILAVMPLLANGYLNTSRERAGCRTRCVLQR